MSETYSFPAFAMTDYNLYRVDDRVFYVFIIAALAFCLIHAARRAFRQPRPTDVHSPPSTSANEEQMERHTLFQRIFHWANAIAIFILAGSGWMIYQPGQVPLMEGPPSEWFLWHRWGVALLLAGIAAHIIREAFIAQEANPMVFNRAEVRRILSIFKNFFGLSKNYPLAGKYHTGQLIFHWAVAGNLFLLILTGMVLWKPLRGLLPLSLFGLGWDFIYFTRILHGFFSATLFASLIGHIYFALFIKKTGPKPSPWSPAACRSGSTSPPIPSRSSQECQKVFSFHRKPGERRKGICACKCPFSWLNISLNPQSLHSQKGVEKKCPKNTLTFFHP